MMGLLRDEGGESHHCKPQKESVWKKMLSTNNYFNQLNFKTSLFQFYQPLIC